jgi:Bacterial Ig-like domain (group 3)/FG-GAP-like repeat/NHL repeat
MFPFIKRFMFVTMLSINAPVLMYGATSTNTTLSIAPATTVTAGTVLTLTATVTGTAVMSGSVVFCNSDAVSCEDAAFLGTATAVKINSTQLSATIRLRFGVGTHNINAIFQPTPLNLGSSSPSQTLTVTASSIYPSSTTITASGSVGNYAFNGTVSGYGLEPLVGTVQLADSTKGNALLASCTLGPPSRGFAAPSTIDAVGNVYSVATGDFNGDGILDIAYPENGGNNISITLGNGDGTFQPHTSYSVGTTAYGLAAGDFNDDGKLDLVVTNWNSNSISILLGNGDGTFQPQTSYSGLSNPSSVAVGDFNGDGILDLVVANFGGASNSVSVLLGNGDGTFQSETPYPTGHSPYSVAVGDFNGDGKLDLVAANNADSTVSILLGNGDGTFQTQHTYMVGDGPSSVVIGDFNSDGKLDLAVNNSYDSNVSVLLGNGDGTFQAQVPYTVDPAPNGVVAGDFDGDGVLDLATANWNSNSISILLGDGDGTFRTSISYPAARIHSLSVGDFNGDGLPDLVMSGNILGIVLGNQTASFSSNSVAVAGPGSQNILASYSGDSDRLASQSTTSVLGAPVATIVSLSTSQDPAPYGSAVTITAAAMELDGVRPTGSVIFEDGGVPIGVGTITGASASLTTSSLAEGSHLLTAVYGGDSDYIAATSASFSQTIALLTSGELIPHESALVFTPGEILTAVGTGQNGDSGDGGPGTGAQVNHPSDTTIDSAGNLYIADRYNNKIRKLNTSTGIITTVAGTGTAGISGDGGLATSAMINSPRGLSVDRSGNIYFTDSANSCVRRVDVTTSLITTAVGICASSGYSGDGGPATSARLNTPTDVVIDSAGNLFIADFGNSCIRKVKHGSTTISTVAGICTAPGFSGDGGPAVDAQMNGSEHVALDTSGNLYVADTNNNRVRKVSGATLQITTIAGIGVASYSGDGELATEATLNHPVGLSFDGSGNLYIADEDNNVIRMVNATTSTITTVAGTGRVSGYNGDGGIATNATLSDPSSVTVSASGILYIADVSNNVVRIVGPSGVLAFGSQPVGVPSISMIQTIANYGSTPLSFTAAPTVTGDFSIQNGNTCGVSILAPGATCNLTIDFIPTSVGSRTGTIQFSDNSSPNTQTLHLSGTGLLGASSILLAATQDPSTYGAPVTFTATLPSGATGSVTFKDGATTLGSASISQGVTSITTTSLLAGTHTITAAYGGDSNYSASTSSNLYQMVNKASAILNLTSSISPSSFGSALTFTATIAAGATGTVTFIDGSNILGSAPVIAGSASITISTLTVGSHSIGATYSGDSNYQ